VSFTAIYWSKILPPYLNPKRTLNLSFVSSFAVQGGGSGAAIRLCMEWSLRLSVWLSSPVQGGGSGLWGLVFVFVVAWRLYWYDSDYWFKFTERVVAVLEATTVLV